MRCVALGVLFVLLFSSPTTAARVDGVDVQVSGGKAIPTVAELRVVLKPGDFVRDQFGWQKADPNCNLVRQHNAQILIPTSLMTLYTRVATVGGRNYVT